MNGQPLVLLYLAWLGFGCMSMWTVSRWSVRRVLPDAATAVAAILAALPIGIVLIALLVTAPEGANPLGEALASHEPTVTLLFFIWPFTAAFTAAQLLLRRSKDLQRARWVSFAAGVSAAGAAPLALLLAGCSATGACL